MAATIHVHRRHLLLLGPKADTYINRPTEGGRLSRPSWLVAYRKDAASGSRTQTVTHPSTNRAQRGLTSLIETNDATTTPNRQLCLSVVFVCSYEVSVRLVTLRAT